MQNRLPKSLQASFFAQNAWHFSVTACEVFATAGLLDPRDPRTAGTVEEVIEFIDRRREDHTIASGEENWIEAGILAGLLARLQHHGRAEHRRVLNDALIFLSAARAGLTVLTRNIVDYDLLMQLAP